MTTTTDKAALLVQFSSIVGEIFWEGATGLATTTNPLKSPLWPDFLTVTKNLNEFRNQEDKVICILLTKEKRIVAPKNVSLHRYYFRYINASEEVQKTIRNTCTERRTVVDVIYL